MYCYYVPIVDFEQVNGNCWGSNYYKQYAERNFTNDYGTCEQL